MLGLVVVFPVGVRDGFDLLLGLKLLEHVVDGEEHLAGLGGLLADQLSVLVTLVEVLALLNVYLLQLLLLRSHLVVNLNFLELNLLQVEGQLLGLVVEI